MRLCRFRTANGPIRPGLSLDGRTVLDLSEFGVRSIDEVLESADPRKTLLALAPRATRAHRLAEVQLLAPVTRQEVWAAGVTYLRSRKARTRESERDASAYERVYEAPRPELFFKSLAEKVVGPGEPVGIRQDATWSVPEPELALVFNSRAQLAGVTMGNDMSSRDIEGENLLYLPQAKIYNRSCALGPWIRVGQSEAQVRRGQVRLTIRRDGRKVFEGRTPLANLQRSFGGLADYLFRSHDFPNGVVLLTGTGVVPPNDFSLRAGDSVRIAISGLGELDNPVVVV